MQRTVMWRTAGAAGLLAVAIASGVAPAAAGPDLSAASTSTTAVAQGVATRLSGMAVSGASAGDTLAVTVATDRGTVRIDTSTGVLLAYGNAATGASVSFTGSPDQVNAALAATDLTTPVGSLGLGATVTLTAYQQQAGIVYGAATGHFYEFVSSAGSWDSARSAASGRSFLGKTGYLVTITSSAENGIVTSRIPNAESVWIGAHAVAGGGYPREWQWADGPEAGQVFDRCSNASGTCNFVSRPGYANWAMNEPNNYGGGTSGVDGEWVAVTNWNSYDGLWNDLASMSSTSGYVVEYGDGSAFGGVATASATVTILGVPGAPTGVSAEPGSEQATVTFTAPASDGGSPIASFTVTASPGGATASCAASPCTVTGLTAWTAYTFRVTATNGVGTGPASGASTAVTAVPQPSAPGAPTGMAATPLVGAPYMGAVTSSGYPFPTYAVTGGALPAGLSLAADGTVTGTPTATGPWSVEITATNTQGTAAATLSGYVGKAPTAITGSIGDLPASEAATIDLDVDGYPAPVWSVTAGALPTGLTLAHSDGMVTGTPTSPGTYSVTVTATNAHGSVARTLTGSVTAPPELVSGSVPQLLVGVASTATFTVDGYPPPTFAVTAGALPAGMALATSGVLSGTPLVVGPWSATITATNTRGSVARTIGGHVGDPPSAVSGTLPALTWGTPVAVLLASAGYPAPTFAVTAGALPAGLSLDPVTGGISGVPTSAHVYSVTITAGNEHGSQAVTFSGTVAPIRPSAPSGLDATPGDGEVAVAFDAPDSDGGSPVTSYEVRVDDGDWQPLATTVDGSTVHGTVTGLVNGVEVELRVRAVNAAGAGLASGRTTVTPVAPPPVPVAAPTAVAGTSSVTVSWLASTERDVTGYTVTASPGPATCTVAADQARCVIGAVAGQPVTFTVVTHSRWGDSVPSQPSLPVVPTSPAVPAAPPVTALPTLTTSEGDISSVAIGQTITVIGTGFAPFSTATVVIYPTPRVLGTVRTDAAGAFSLTVTVPRDLEAGQHTFVAFGVDTSGEPYAMRLPVELPAAATSMAQTGAAVQPLVLLALVSLGGGMLLRVAATRRTRRAR